MSEQINEMINASHETPRSSVGRRVGLALVLLAVVIFMLALGYGYFQLAKANQSLAASLIDLRERSKRHEQEINDFQQAAEKVQSLSAEQAQMISDWQAAQKGDMNKWQVAEAQYLVNLANDQLIFTQNTTMAISMLSRAAVVLNRLNDERLAAIQQSLARDMAALQASPQLNLTQLYAFLSALNQQLDQLPLPAMPLKKVDQTIAQPQAANESWWQTGWHRSLEAIQKIVIVQYNAKKTLPLVMPDEKGFLYQNLHAQMESAMWALLHRQPEIYQQSLASVNQWITTYFDMNAPETQTVLQRLQALQHIQMAPVSFSFSETLRLFHLYLDQSNVVKVNS